MDWLQVLVILLAIWGLFGAVLGLFFFFFSESREDYRHVETQLDGMRDLIAAIHAEMKDFHGRLCAIEERNKK